MAEFKNIKDIISSAKKVKVVGEGALSQRPIGRTMKHMMQAGALGAIAAVQLLGGASASNTGYEYVSEMFESPIYDETVVYDSETNGKLDSIEFINPLEYSKGGRELIREDNTINSLSLLDKWRSHNIDEKAIIYLTEILTHTQSPAFVTEKAEKEAILKMAERTKDIFDISSNDEAIDFLKNHNPEKLMEDGLITIGARVINQSHGEYSDEYSEVNNYWNHLKQVARDDRIDNVNISMEGAVDSIYKAMQTSGLNSLKMPMQMWTSPSRVNEVATRINTLNDLAQDLTGWEGPVLGFNGRNSIHYGAPNNHGGISVSNFVEGGNILYGKSEVMIHEIGHAFDYSLSYDLGVMSSHEMFPELKQIGQVMQTEEIPDTPLLLTNVILDVPYHVIADKPYDDINIYNTWAGLLAGLDYNSYTRKNSFYERLDNMAESGQFDESMSLYYTSINERMAFSFEGYALSKSYDLAVSVGMNEEYQEIPLGEEALSSHEVWENTFESLSGWWNNQLQKNHSQDHTNNINQDFIASESDVEFDGEVSGISASSILSKRKNSTSPNITSSPKFTR